MQLAVEVAPVVVLPQHLVGAGVADAFDHRGVVAFVREDHGIGDLGAEGRERGPVRDVARGEEQRRFLAVQVCEFAFEDQVVVVGAGDVARATRARAAGLHRVDHRRDDIGVLAHAEVVVRAPDGDFAHLAVLVVGGAGEGAAAALHLGEDAVVAFGLEGVELAAEVGVEIHVSAFCWSGPCR